MLMERRLRGVFWDLRGGDIEYSKSNFKLQGAYMTDFVISRIGGKQFSFNPTTQK